MKQTRLQLSPRAFWLCFALLVCLRCALSGFQQVYTWVGGAPLDDELMFRAANAISAGQWLGAYDYLTLSKSMFFPVWLAALHALHLPYLTAGAGLWCAASGLAAAALRPLWAAAPAGRGRCLTLALYAALALLPSSWAAYTLRVYRDNIFPALCIFFFAGLCGWALRWRGPLAKGLPWLGMSGLGLALAWLTREDGMWLLPFAAAGSLILLVTALRAAMPLAKKLARCAALAVPFALLAAGILAFSAVNYAYYGVFTVSDFSSGGFSAAMGAMMRVEAGQWQPLVSVNAEARQLLYEKVPALAPLEKWLEEDEDLQNSFRNPELDDYQSGSFYWAIRKAAYYEGVYDSAQKAEEYWQGVADAINELCDAGELPSNGPRRTGTTPPIRAEYVGPVLKEGLHSLWYSLTFGGCEPYDAENLSIGPTEDLEVWENYLGQRTNSAAQAGTALPYYSPVQRLVYLGLEVLRAVYAVALPVAFAAAVALQVKNAAALLGGARKKRPIAPGRGMLALLLAGLFAMALLRCFMIAFVEVASFNIGTYAMYLSTVHPLLLLFSAAGILTLWKENVSWQN